ncbi:MAG TPA: polysaccharide deacetylase family protein [Roseomonas sp.]
MTVETGYHLCPSISAEEIRRGVQDLSTLSWQAYAGKAGFYRLMDTAHAHGIPSSGVFSGIAVERYPDLAREFAACGNEIIAHSWAQEVRSFRLDEEGMRANIGRTLDVIQKVTGQRPVGWMSPMSQPGENTVTLLAEAGFNYILDFADDDSPYLLNAGNGQHIMAVPASFDVNDHQIYARGLNPPSAYVDVFRHTLNRLLEEGRQGTPWVMSAVFSGNLYGHPLGAWALRECIRYAKSLPGVWITTHRDHVAHLLDRAGGSS